MFRIYITGPESAGKTRLSKALAAHYRCAWVPEYARQYLTERNGHYQYEDLIKISDGQVAMENQFQNLAPTMLIMDTGHAVLHIWSMHKFNQVDDLVVERLKKQRGALHLLCKPDLDWAPDPLRESQGERDQLYMKYLDLLKTMNLEYVIIAGDGQARVERAIKLVDQFIE